MEQDKKKQLTINDVKNIIKDIEEDEVRNSGFNGKIRNLTAVEYYKESFKNKNLTLVKKISSLTVPLTAKGIYRYKDSTVIIFMKSDNKILDPNTDLFSFILTCYHEIRHNLQDSLPVYCFDKFACDIDGFIAQFNPVIYNKKHNSFYNEINANNYAIEKAREYLENKFPDIYNNKEVQGKFEERKDVYFTDYVLFDIVNSIEETSYLLKKHKFSKDEKDDISPILNIFFNEDNSFRSFKEIFSNEKFKDVDTRISCAFFSSKSFLDSIDLNNLDYNELDILYKSLEYTNKLYERQYKIIESEKKNYKERIEFFFMIQKNIFRRISYLRSTLRLIKVFEKRQAKSYRGHGLHKKKIPEYLDKTNYLLNSKKNNGFIIIDIFYIISFIVSIIVVGYLILF